MLTLQWAAVQMRENGQENGAEQLAEVLGMGEVEVRMVLSAFEVNSYEELLQVILEVVTKSQGDPQTVYPILKQYQKHFNDDFVDFLRYWGERTIPNLELGQKMITCAGIFWFTDLIQIS